MPSGVEHSAAACVCEDCGEGALPASMPSGSEQCAAVGAGGLHRGELQPAGVLPASMPSGVEHGNGVDEDELHRHAVLPASMPSGVEHNMPPGFELPSEGAARFDALGRSALRETERPVRQCAVLPASM